MFNLPQMIKTCWKVTATVTKHWCPGYTFELWNVNKWFLEWFGIVHLNIDIWTVDTLDDGSDETQTETKSISWIILTYKLGSEADIASQSHLSFIAMLNFSRGRFRDFKYSLRKHSFVCCSLYIKIQASQDQRHEANIQWQTRKKEALSI